MTIGRDWQRRAFAPKYLPDPMAAIDDGLPPGAPRQLTMPSAQRAARLGVLAGERMGLRRPDAARAVERAATAAQLVLYDAGIYETPWLTDIIHEAARIRAAHIADRAPLSRSVPMPGATPGATEGTE